MANSPMQAAPRPAPEPQRKEPMKTISTPDRIAAYAIACEAERDAITRAERADNWAAAQINRARLVIAEDRLAKAIAATN